MILSEGQIQWVVTKINEEVDLPIIGEDAEKELFTKAVEKVLELLEKELPPSLLKLITEAGESLPPKTELKEIKSNLVDFINKNVNIPLIGERKEKKLFAKLVDLLFDAITNEKAVESA